MILKRLEEFEINNEFTEINIITATMVKKMNTHTKYLTTIIKYYRNKNFTSYTNELRIKHIIQRLKTDTKLQQYKVKAQAKEAGFNSAEVFSKSFFKKTGIYPSYFIKQLQTSEK